MNPRTPNLLSGSSLPHCVGEITMDRRTSARHRIELEQASPRRPDFQSGPAASVRTFPQSQLEKEED